MVGVRASITRWVSDNQPGFIECQLNDALGRTWTFVDKVPVLTVEDIDASSHFPRPCIIACTVIEIGRGPDGRELATIDTTEPWGLAATDDTAVFEVHFKEIVEI